LALRNSNAVLIGTSRKKVVARGNNVKISR